jgi:hypothetical protein
MVRVILIAWCFAWMPAFGFGQTTALAWSNMAIPDLVGGTLNQFNVRGPSVNASGQLAFFATTTGTSASGAFRLTGTTLETLGRQGQATGFGGSYGAFTINASGGGMAPSINASGTVAFSSFVGGIQTIVRHNGTTGSLVVQDDTAAPGGGTYSGFYVGPDHRIGIDSTGRISMNVDIDGEGASNVVRYTGTTGTMIARDGTAAPGSLGNYRDGPGYSNMNAAGQVVFYSSVGDGATAPFEAIFRYDGTTVTPIVIDGDLTSGHALGGMQNNIYQINSSGVVGFHSNTSTGPGIFKSSGSGVTAVAVTLGSTPIGGTYAGVFSGAPHINDSGAMAFVANVTGGSASFGIFRGDGTNTTTIARLTGDAPTSTVGTTFAEFDRNLVRLNNLGVTAFRGRVTAITGITTSNDWGLWFGSSEAGLTLIAREGDFFTVNGASRQISATNFSSGTMDFSLTDSGIYWLANFTDGTQAIMYTPVPEVAHGIALTGVAWLGWRIRRSRVVA